MLEKSCHTMSDIHFLMARTRRVRALASMNTYHINARIKFHAIKKGRQLRHHLRIGSNWDECQAMSGTDELNPQSNAKNFRNQYFAGLRDLAENLFRLERTAYEGSGYGHRDPKKYDKNRHGKRVGRATNISWTAGEGIVEAIDRYVPSKKVR